MMMRVWSLVLLTTLISSPVTAREAFKFAAWFEKQAAPAVYPESQWGKLRQVK